MSVEGGSDGDEREQRGSARKRKCGEREKGKKGRAIRQGKGKGDGRESVERREREGI